MDGQSITFSSFILSPEISTVLLPLYSGVIRRVTVVPFTESNPTFTWPKEEETIVPLFVIFPKVSDVENIYAEPESLQFLLPSISSVVKHSKFVPVFATKVIFSPALHVNSLLSTVKP